MNVDVLNCWAEFCCSCCLFVLSCHSVLQIWLWKTVRYASSQIPPQNLGCPEAEAGHLCSSTSALHQVPREERSHSRPLEAFGSPVPSQPKHGAERTGAGCPDSHLLPSTLAGRPVGRRGLDIRLQIRQQWQSESPGRWFSSFSCSVFKLLTTVF